MKESIKRKIHERSYDKKLKEMNRRLDFSSRYLLIKGTEDKKLARCYELLDIDTGKRILDMGCGDGFRSLRYAEQGGIVIGFDISKKAVKIAREKATKYPNATFLLADAEYMPFKSSCFDIASCIALIEHVDNQDKLVSEISRVLKTNGKVLIQTLNKKNKYAMNGILKTFFPAYEERLQKGAVHSYHRFLTVDDLEELCYRYGLDVDYVAHTETFVDWIWIHVVLLNLTRMGRRYLELEYTSQKSVPKEEYRPNLHTKDTKIHMLIRFYNSIVFPIVYRLSLVDKIIEHWGYSGIFTVVGSKYTCRREVIEK